MLATAGSPTTWQGANISGDPTTKGTSVAEEISTAVQSQTAATTDNLATAWTSGKSTAARTTGDADKSRTL
jgi:hypothetical protein